MRSDLINSRDPSIWRQTPCRLVQQGCLPFPFSLHCCLQLLNCSLAAVRFTVPMHVSLCICGQMALSVLDCELVSIWLFVYPSVTCNISAAIPWILIACDRKMPPLWSGSFTIALIAERDGGHQVIFLPLGYKQYLKNLSDVVKIMGMNVFSSPGEGVWLRTS